MIHHRLLPPTDRRPDDGLATGENSEIDALRLELSAANAELSRRDSFMAAVLETIDVGIVFCGPDGRDWTRNRAGRALLGLGLGFDEDDTRTLDPDRAAPFMDIFDATGADVAVGDYPILRVLKGEDVGAVELLVGPSGGPHREIVTLNTRILDAEGNVLGAVSALTDVTPERSANRALAGQRRQLVEAQRIGCIGSFELDYSTGCFSLSAQLCALWGIPADGSVAPTDGLLHPDDRDVAYAWWAVASVAGGTHAHELRIVRGEDGTERRIRVSVEIDLGPDGTPTLVRGTVLDITDLAAAEHAAGEAHAFLTAVLTASPDYTFITALSHGALVYGSPGKSVLGLTTDELEAMEPQRMATLVHPDDAKRLGDANLAAVDMVDGAVLQVRYRGRHIDGQWRWLNRRVTPFKRDADGHVVEILGVVSDVTDVVAVEERLTHASMHDHLTGLPNRTLLLDRLRIALHRAVRDGREVTVLFCDLDGFKQVNDSAGHDAGDAVLQETGRRITSAVRVGDTVARIGGDEFVILIEPRTVRLEGASGPTDVGTTHLEDGTASATDDVSDRALGASIAARVAAAVRRPIVHDGVEHLVTASIGMTFSGGRIGTQRGGTDPEAMLKRADDLMYQAKNRGKDRIEAHLHPHHAPSPDPTSAPRD